MRFSAIAILAMGVGLSACSVSSLPNDDYLIGQKVKDVSSLTSDQGLALNKISLYDKTVDLIHQFDLSTLKLDRSLVPQISGGEHAILYHQGGNYVIDLYQQYLGIYNKQGQLNAQPIHFAGMPKSAAFRPSLGYLVVYDDRQSVGVLKLDGDGNVAQSWVGGPLLDSGSAAQPPSITAGDVDESGRLIVGMTDNSIAVVDLAQSLTQQKWVYTSFASTLTDIKWVAPVTGQPDLVLIRSSGQISLLRLSTQSVIDHVSFTESNVSVKTSKAFDAHVLLVNGTNLTIYYVKGSALNSRTVNFDPRNLLSSRLSLSQDSWTVVDSRKGNYRLSWKESHNGIWFEFDQPNAYIEARMIRRYRLSTLTPLPDVQLPDQAQLELTEDHVFELFPSKFGYAVYYGMVDGSKNVLKMFNKALIH